MDYQVPDFGVDHEIKQTHDHIAQQEAILGVKWVPEQDADGKWVVPTEAADFKLTGMKSEINLKDDPICSSAGCTQYKHPAFETFPMDYPVPDFGMDHEIKQTHEHIA